MDATDAERLMLSLDLEAGLDEANRPLDLRKPVSIEIVWIAVIRPMPVPPPVTSATLSASMSEAK